MKAFITILIIFALLAGIIIVNNIYIRNTARQLTEMTESLPDTESAECLLACEELNLYWQKNRGIVSFSVAFPELNQVSDQIASLVSYAASAEDAEFEHTRCILLNAIREMERLERLSVFNIF